MRATDTTERIFHVMLAGRRYHPNVIKRLCRVSRRTVDRHIKRLLAGNAVEVVRRGRFKLYETRQLSLLGGKHETEAKP